jgi:hypothetical protein
MEEYMRQREINKANKDAAIMKSFTNNNTENKV